MNPLWRAGSAQRFEAKGQPSKLTDLPKELREALDSHLIEQGFSNRLCKSAGGLNARDLAAPSLIDGSYISLQLKAG
jgi:hypothetical protein